MGLCAQGGDEPAHCVPRKAALMVPDTTAPGLRSYQPDGATEALALSRRAAEQREPATVALECHMNQPKRRWLP